MLSFTSPSTEHPHVFFSILDPRPGRTAGVADVSVLADETRRTDVRHPIRSGSATFAGAEQTHLGDLLTANPVLTAVVDFAVDH